MTVRWVVFFFKFFYCFCGLLFGIAQWLFCFSTCNVVGAPTRDASDIGDARERANQAGHFCSLRMRNWMKMSSQSISVCVPKCVSTFLNACVSAVPSPLFSVSHISICVCIFAFGRNLGRATASGQNRADRRMNMPRCDRERGKRLCWKQGRTRGRKGREKLDAGGESGERRGPWPDHTDTLGSLSPRQLCIVVDPERTHSHTHILIYACWRWGHTWPGCMCVCVCVFECDSLSMRAKESVDATKNPTVCVCFPSSLCAFVFTSLNLCAHLCVCVRIFTRLPGCAGAHFHLFFLLGCTSGQDIGVQRVPSYHSIISASLLRLHMCVEPANH